VYYIGGPHPLRGRGRFGGHSPDLFEWCIFETEMYLTHAWKVHDISIPTIRPSKCLFIGFWKM